ncbi:hypothetical protein SCARR_03303 [Pontiella sulfatireligans]|uniref:Ice-binding protein C-terminal domain-containing protein n=2 Tax=Pontiella sulfatireligans TaxID=2750658 RepID=A0A6C2UPN3_9BACT|nr:hypothetical protein SCARR_03303 [Pontiella sulfatireligans]
MLPAHRGQVKIKTTKGEKMKIKAIIAVMAVAAVSQAGLVTWQSSNWGAASFDGVTLIDGWQAGLYTGATLQDGPWDVADLGVGLLADTTVNINQAGPPLTHAFGIDALGVDVADDIPLYTVLFNNADKLLASQYLVVDAATVGSGAVQAPGTPVGYTLGAPVGTWQTVVAIPEPATLGLMGIAGLGMYLARKKVRS